MLIISLYGFDGKASQFNKDLCSLSKQMKTTTIAYAYRSVNKPNIPYRFVNMKTTTKSCRSVNMRTPGLLPTSPWAVETDWWLLWPPTTPWWASPWWTRCWGAAAARESRDRHAKACTGNHCK